MSCVKNPDLTRLRQSGLVRFAVIGTGGMGHGHCDALQKLEGARLTAVCDICPEVAEKTGREFNVPFFTDHESLIKSGLCDAVMVATPHPVHPVVAIPCMRAGLHVISEKPLSERIATARQMVRAARKCGVALTVMFQRRFESACAVAIRMMRAGRLGKLYRATLISPEYRSQAYYDSGTWRATWKGEGGGVMMNQSPHILDLFVQLAGKPSAVFGHTETRMHRIEVEDLGEAMLRFPGGGTGYIFCSTTEAGPGQMIELFGDQGKLLLRNGNLQFFRFEPAIREHIRTAQGMWEGPKVIEEPLVIPQAPCGHACVIANFTRHLLFGEALVTRAEEALDSLELANAITLSAHTGKWEKLPLSEKRYDALLGSLRRRSRFVKRRVKTQRVTDPRVLK